MLGKDAKINWTNLTRLHCSDAEFSKPDGHLIRDLLNYSRLATRSEPLDTVDLRKAVMDVVSDLELQI